MKIDLRLEERSLIIRHLMLGIDTCMEMIIKAAKSSDVQAILDVIPQVERLNQLINHIKRESEKGEKNV